MIDQLISLADAHRDADEYATGHYEWYGNACAIGCTIRDANIIGLTESIDTDDHAAIGEALGVSEFVMRLVDNIFEGIGNIRSAWPPRFLRAVKSRGSAPNLDERIMVRFCRQLADDAMEDQIKACAELNASLWQRRADGDDPTEKEWDAARQQANVAWHQADAAWLQADAAWLQAHVARHQADVAAWHQADVAAWRASAGLQADVAGLQASAARQYWSWAADMLCEEMSKTTRDVAPA